MTKPIAFKATFSDMRQVKGRKVYQLTFEVPAEKVDEALEVLGGAPHSEKEVWCGITQLNPLDERSTREPSPQPISPPSASAGEQHERIEQSHPSPKHADPAGTDPQSRPGGAKRMAVRFGILCREEKFQRFLFEEGHITALDAEEAAEAVRAHCGVESRSEIDGDPAALEQARRLLADYDVWQRALV